MESQIYSAPKVPTNLSQPARHALCYTDGSSLYVAPGFQSADKCLITGEILNDLSRRKKQSLAYTPIWALVLLFLGIIGILVILVVTKNGKIETAFSPSITKKFRTRKLVLLTMFLVSLLGFWGAASLSSSALAIVSGVLLLTSLVGACIATRPLKVRGYKDGYFKITNVHLSVLQDVRTQF